MRWLRCPQPGRCRPGRPEWHCSLAEARAAASAGRERAQSLSTVASRCYRQMARTQPANKQPRFGCVMRRVGPPAAGAVSQPPRPAQQRRSGARVRPDNGGVGGAPPAAAARRAPSPGNERRNAIWPHKFKPRKIGGFVLCPRPSSRGLWLPVYGLFINN